MAEFAPGLRRYEAVSVLHAVLRTRQTHSPVFLLRCLRRGMLGRSNRSLAPRHAHPARRHTWTLPEPAARRDVHVQWDVALPDVAPGASDALRWLAFTDAEMADVTVCVQFSSHPPHRAGSCTHMLSRVLLRRVDDGFAGDVAFTLPFASLESWQQPRDAAITVIVLDSSSLSRMHADSYYHNLIHVII